MCCVWNESLVVEESLLRYKNKVKSFIVIAFLFCFGTQALAYPELTRYGYFSCSSCHVSPSGGGLLTPYGRGLSVEKLSTWGQPSEGLFAHGLGSKNDAQGSPNLPWLPEWLLVGGNIRYMQLDTQTADRQDGRWIRMQSDLSLGLLLPKTTIVVTGGPRGETRSKPKLAGELSLRNYYVKIDHNDLSVRGGRFFPKFGLDLAQHQLFVRRGLGFDQGQENLNLEVTWFSEHHEISLTRMFGVHSSEKDGSLEKGFTASWAYHLFEKHRVGAQILQGSDTAKKRELMGLFASFSLSERWFLLAEEYRQTVRPKGDLPYDQYVFYHRLGYEALKGLVASFVFEGTAPQIRDLKTRRETTGLGLQWFPRPHFEIDSFVGATLNHTNYTFSTVAYLIGHYYL